MEIDSQSPDSHNNVHLISLNLSSLYAILIVHINAYSKPKQQYHEKVSSIIEIYYLYVNRILLANYYKLNLSEELPQ